MIYQILDVLAMAGLLRDQMAQFDLADGYDRGLRNRKEE
jgi:hypothetical protein